MGSCKRTRVNERLCEKQAQRTTGPRTLGGNGPTMGSCEGKDQGNRKIYFTVSASQLHPCNSTELSSSEPTYRQAFANLSGMLSRMGINLAPISSALLTGYVVSYSGKKRSRSFRAQKILGIDRATTFGAAWATVNRLTTF